MKPPNKPLFTRIAYERYFRGLRVKKPLTVYRTTAQDARIISSAVKTNEMRGSV